MNDSAAIEVEFEALGDLLTGVWCPHCALPSAFALAFSIRTGKGDRTLHVLCRCVECGAGR